MHVSKKCHTVLSQPTLRKKTEPKQCPLGTVLKNGALFEHTCAYARWALMHRFLSVRLSVTGHKLRWLENNSYFKKHIANERSSVDSSSGKGVHWYSDIPVNEQRQDWLHRNSHWTDTCHVTLQQTVEDLKTWQKAGLTSRDLPLCLSLSGNTTWLTQRHRNLRMQISRWWDAAGHFDIKADIKGSRRWVACNCMYIGNRV